MSVSEIFPNPDIGGFVNSNPPDGFVTLDRMSWDPEELRSVDCPRDRPPARFRCLWQRRRSVAMALGSEAWAECAAVDAGLPKHRQRHGRHALSLHADTELEQYRFAVSRLGEVCASWGQSECRTVAPISG